MREPLRACGLLDQLSLDARLGEDYRFHATRAHLYEMAGDLASARAAYVAAAERAPNLTRKRYLNTQASACSDVRKPWATPTYQTNEDATDRFSSRLAIVGTAVAFVSLISLHVLSPEYSPACRMVSEYAMGHYAWVLSLMFAAFGLSELALALGYNPCWPRVQAELAG